MKNENCRELIRFDNLEDARNSLQTRLNTLKDVISHLTVEDLLPPSILTSQPNLVDISDVRETELMISDSTKVRKNQLAELVYLDPKYFVIPEVEEEEEEEEEQDDEQQSIKKKEEEEKAHFTLHINFGNDNLESAVRIMILTPPELIPLMNFLKTQETTDFSSIKKKFPQIHILQLKRVLHTLISLGFFHPL